MPGGPDSVTSCKETWEESGGPPVQDAERVGFGRTFIERAVGRTLDGSASLDFRPEGVFCKLEIPGYHLLRYEQSQSSTLV